MNCARCPCGASSGGCSFSDCVFYSGRASFGVYPTISQPVMGCICPPTSEKTCEAPMCPRKNWLKSIDSSVAAYDGTPSSLLPK